MNKDGIMVSVIVPIYNAERYLSECIDSLLRQSFKDIEIILVNDGSSDGSEIICKRYAENDDRIVYVHQQNGGVSVARNTALNMARGIYACFVDSDDIVASNYIQHLLELTTDGDFAICSYTRKIDQLGSKDDRIDIYDANNFIIRVFDESIMHPNIWMMLFKMDIIKKYSLSFTPGCVRNEDTEFYIKYMTHEKRIIKSGYKGYYYRDTPDSAVHKFDEKSLTFIDADQRISDYLMGKGLVNTPNLIVPASVQFFVYQTARHNNAEIYSLLHKRYDVRAMMKSMTMHHRMLRKGVAWVYLLLGRKLFFKMLSLI